MQPGNQSIEQPLDDTEDQLIPIGPRDWAAEEAKMFGGEQPAVVNNILSERPADNQQQIDSTVPPTQINQPETSKSQ